MSASPCSVPGCSGQGLRLIALCGKHARVHLKAAEEQGRAPFERPYRNDPHEKKFNNRQWFWFRESWRLSGDT